MNTDEIYMQRAVALARGGLGNVAPNPMVGAVVVAEGRIIGEGFHRQYGGSHAEVNALASVSAADQHLLHEATIYVSLEPCAHYGKTPPCADLIVAKGLKRCVVGCVDPFALVQGRGIEKLREAGIEVRVGVLEDECRALNKHFFTFHQLQRPFITLKWAQTADGYIGIDDERLIISNATTQALCHKRRAEHMGILVGRRTWEVDRPRLDTRLWAGNSPRIYVLSHKDGSVEDLLAKMYAEGIQSLLVEGGQATLQSFIDLGLWDEAYVETSPQTIVAEASRRATSAPRLHNATLTNTQRFDNNILQSFKHS